jgi:four helix bundle protein
VGRNRAVRLADEHCTMTDAPVHPPIYDRARNALAVLAPLAARLAARDRELTIQLRRAAASVLLNLAEGAGMSRGNRRTRYDSALGSARETLAALHVAEAWGYLAEEDARVLDEIDHLVATLVCFVQRVR